jgi:type IV pilus assembly protein PilC
MDYEYIAATEDNRVVKGKLSAASERSAADLLSYGGYRVLRLKEVVPFFQPGRLTSGLFPVQPSQIVMFSRQLALLLESGTDVITALELLQSQLDSRSLKRIIGEVISDVRNGSPLSEAISKHPQAFSALYHRLVSVGERTGSLEIVLRRAAAYIERSVITRKSVKNALVYPVILVVATIAVIGVMVGFVLPAFAGFYASFGVDLPAPTRALLAFTDWSQRYGLWVLLVMAAALAAGFIYTRTPVGKYQWGKAMLTVPRVGRINRLNELARCCRTMSLLYRSGLPLPEIMTLVIQGTSNRAMSRALTEVQRSMIAGQGLSGPMGQNSLFLPLMVQMTAVGEETGNLDNTLDTVAESYEAESDDKTKAMIALITPAMTVIIGGIIGFIAVSLLSAMYSIYGQVGI